MSDTMVAQEGSRTLSKKYSSFSIPVPKRSSNASSDSNAQTMTERLVHSKRRMMAKVSRSGQNVSKKHLAGYYPSNVTMKGRLYKKRKGINRLTTMTLTTLTNDTSQSIRKMWPLRYVSLKDGVISYYKLSDALDDHHTMGGEKVGSSRRSQSTGYRSEGATSDDGTEQDLRIDQDDLFRSRSQERGAIDLRRTGVMLRLSYPTNNFGQEFQQFDEGGKDEAGGTSKSPTPYQFEIVYNNLMNPKEWNTWTLAAPTKESLFHWLAAISSVIYANRGSAQEDGGHETPHWIDADRYVPEKSPEPKSAGDSPRSLQEITEEDLLEDDDGDAEVVQEGSDESVSTVSDSCGEEAKDAAASVLEAKPFADPSARYHLSKDDVMQEMGALVLLGNMVLFAAFREHETTLPLVLLTAWNIFIFMRVFSWIKSAEWTGYSKAQLASRAAKPNVIVTKAMSVTQNMRSTTPTRKKKATGGDKIPIAQHLRANHPFHAWTSVPRDVLNMRIGPDYKSKRMKAPSNDPFFEPLGADTYHSSSKLDHVLRHVQFPADMLKERQQVKASEWPKGLPKLLVINLQIPIVNGVFSMLSSSEDEYYNFIMYYAPSLAFAELMGKIERNEEIPASTDANNARLAVKWLLECQTNQALKRRLKLLNLVMNPDEAGLPGFMSKFNGKPCMCTRSASIHRAADNSYLEIDIDSGMWGVMPRRAAGVAIPGILKRCVLSLAFIIQGDTDDELPERPFTAIQLVYINAKKVPWWPLDSGKKKKNKGRRRRNMSSFV